MKLKADAFSNRYFETYDSGKYYIDSPDIFRQKINLRARELAEWGFKERSETSFNTRSDFKNHWWLKYFNSKRNDNPQYFPNNSDWSKIKSIQQFTFRKNGTFIIEEWQLKNKDAAKRWLQITVKNKSIDNSKPPRIFWKEGDKMYFIIATEAKDWFDYGDKLIELLTGKSRNLLELFNDPFDLAKYKKATGANSSSKQPKKYHYKPDTIGTHYNYFFFHHLRPKFKTAAFNGLYIHTYIYGNEIGTYKEVNEELISIKSKLPDELLGKLNFVGKSIKEISEILGDQWIYETEYIWAEHDDDYLVLHVENNKVDWFHYTRTNGKYIYAPLFPFELEFFDEEIPEDY